MTHSLGVRFGLAVVLLVWVPLLGLTGGTAYFLWLRTGDVESRPSAALRSLALHGDALRLTEAAASMAESIDLFLLDRIAEVQTWAQSPVVAEAVQRARAAHEKQGLDDLAPQQIENRFRTRKTLGLSPAATAYLKEQIQISPHFAEVFFTDGMGYNVALTNPTSDFVQSDETWWQRAWSSGFSVGQIEYDSSANVWSLDFSVRIHDSQNDAPIGVMKAVLSIRFVQEFADRLMRRLSASGRLLHPQLSGSTVDDAMGPQILVGTADGMLVAETRSRHARGRIMKPEVNLLTNESLTYLNLSYEGGDRSGSFIAAQQDPQDRLNQSAANYLVAFARSASTDLYAPVVRNFPGFDWLVIVEAPNLSGRTVLPELAETQWQDLRSWVSDVLWLGVAMCVSLLFSSVFLCWLFGRWVLAPVRLLTHRAQRMEQGHISGAIALSSKGELSELATALDRLRQMITKMADRLHQTTAGQTQPKV